tara:strand:- start:461 stop:1060 length:600 start_codon:yes stop_codon:yes gene_type:complete
MKKRYLLKVRQLCCKRNYRLIFENLSFQLNPGEIILIDGKNGSGKTSLLLSIAGVLSCEGDILFKDSFHKKIGYVGHQNALNEADTVEDFLKYWKNIYNHTSGSETLLEVFELKKYLHYSIHSLSFGQKKKLSFLRLLMIQSKIWLLDEPLSGLDKRNEILILNLLEEHTSNGGGIVLTSHQKLNLDKNNENITRVSID